MITITDTTTGTTVTASDWTEIPGMSEQEAATPSPRDPA